MIFAFLDEKTRGGRQVDLPWLPGLAPSHPEHGGAVILHDTAPRISGNAASAVANAHTESGILRVSHDGQNCFEFSPALSRLGRFR